MTNGSSIRDLVFVHANAGKLVNRYSLVDNALFRVLHEQNTGNQVWQEGDAFPGALNVDQQHRQLLGRLVPLLLQRVGPRLVQRCRRVDAERQQRPDDRVPERELERPTTNYCNGVTSDDVVAHEWGHAYTEYTHDLIYQWQPGALNESYSDIWGEVVDMLNGVGTDSPATSARKASARRTRPRSGR